MLITSVNVGKPAAQVSPLRYAAMRRAILKALPEGASGLTWPEIVEAAGPHLPADLFPELKTVQWYSTAVRLDMETCGEVERLSKSKPPRFRFASQLGAQESDQAARAS